MVELFVLFQRILFNTVIGGLLVKRVIPPIPTMNNVTPTQTVLPNNRTNRPNNVNETTAKLKASPPLIFLYCHMRLKIQQLSQPTESS